MQYEKPTVEVIPFDEKDVVTASACNPVDTIDADCPFDFLSE